MHNVEAVLWPFRRALILTLLCIVALLSQSPAFGHNLGQSYTYLKIYDDKITGRFEIILDDLNRVLAHFSVLRQGSAGCGLNHNGRPFSAP